MKKVVYLVPIIGCLLLSFSSARAEQERDDVEGKEAQKILEDYYGRATVKTTTKQAFVRWYETPPHRRITVWESRSTEEIKYYNENNVHVYIAFVIKSDDAPELNFGDYFQLSFRDGILSKKVKIVGDPTLAEVKAEINKTEKELDLLYDGVALGRPTKRNEFLDQFLSHRETHPRLWIKESEFVMSTATHHDYHIGINGSNRSVSLSFHDGFLKSKSKH